MASWKDTSGHLIDENRPYPDAIAASCLCGHGGAALYYINDGMNFITNDLLTNRIAPNITRLYGTEVAKVLALPIIYAATQLIGYDDIPFSWLPNQLKQRVLKTLKDALGQVEVDKLSCIVKKKTLIVNGHGGQVILVPLEELNSNDQDVSPTNTYITGQSNTASTSQSLLLNELRGLQTNLINLKRRIEEIHGSIQAEIHDNHTHITKKIQRLDTSIKRIAVQPVIRRIVDEGTENELPNCIPK